MGGGEAYGPGTGSMTQEQNSLAKNGRAFSDQEISDFSQSQPGGGLDPSLLKYVAKNGSGYDYSRPGSGQAVDAFLAWKQKRDQVNLEHEQYVNLVKQYPGRDGTILTAPESKTVLA